MDPRSVPQSLAADVKVGGLPTPGAPPNSAVRQSLDALLKETVASAAAASGYRLSDISFGETVEVTLEKGGATFVWWLRSANDRARCFKSTAHFKIGYRKDPPDRLGYALLKAICGGIEVWERSLPEGAHTQLFTPTRLQPRETTQRPATSLDPATEALVSQTTFAPIYQEWLAVREQQLLAAFQNLETGRKKEILLVNAMQGLPFYASMVDFFALLQRTHPGIRVTSASYFENIFEFHQGVAAKGVPVASVADVMTWSTAEINRFDVIILIGPSDVMAKLMALEGLTAKLILLDLGFYHQLIESYQGWSPGSLQEIFPGKSSQMNGVVCYSCQPESKVTQDFPSLFSFRLLEWRHFNYIPIGFTYCTYYRTDLRRFDVGLLGTGGRDYAQLDPDLLGGLRFLFLGNVESAPGIDRLLTKLDVTVVSHVNEDTYARLLALCRCVVLPAHVYYQVNNVFLSVVDAVASGKALVTPRHVGLARLEQDHLPAVFYDNTQPVDLHRTLNGLLHQDGGLQDIETRSIAFAKEKLDIYRILGMILREQVL